MFYSKDHGADCSISNPWGFTALYMATDSPNILKRMLQQGKADVNQRCGERLEAPLHLAAVVRLHNVLVYCGDIIMCQNRVVSVWFGHNLKGKTYLYTCIQCPFLVIRIRTAIKRGYKYF